MTTRYDLRTLSPLDFEELVRDLLIAEWGFRLESFSPGRDQGIDARYAVGPDKVIVQAKHMEVSGYSKLLTVLRKEHGRALALSPTRYALATSVSLTAARKEEIIALMAGVPLAASDIFGREELLELIGRHERVERRHFKLWLGSTAVLERILHSNVYNRTAAEIDTIRKKLPLFVPNASVEEAEAMLDRAGTLIIQGAPGVGKTTLARMLLWLHAEQGWEIFAVDTLDDALTFAHGDAKRLIMLDDFLGQYRLSHDQMRGVDARFPPLAARIAASKNLRFILTTRDYILAQARGMSSKLATGQVDARDYVLSVGAYTRGVKARILYNHLYFSGLSDAQLLDILKDDFFLRIIDHKNFNPRIIELVTSQAYLDLTDRPLRETIETVLANPEVLWEVPYRQHIDSDGRALMLALFLSGRVAIPGQLKLAFGRVSGALGNAVHPADLEQRFKAAFKVLDGSVLAVHMGITLFANPGVNDFVQGVIRSDRLLPILLPVAQTPFELRTLWTFLTDDKTGSKGPIPPPPEWTAAFDRARAAGSADDFTLVALAVDLYSALQDHALLERIAALLDEIEGLDPSEDDIAAVRSLLEQSMSSGLPDALAARFQSVMTRTAAIYLVEFAMSMSFEDFAVFDEELHTHADDEQAAIEASREALGNIAYNIESELRELNNVEDLEEFESSLIALMVERGVDTLSVSYEIEQRREHLYEQGAVSDRRGYSRGGIRRREAGTGDHELRSMFGGLKP